MPYIRKERKQKLDKFRTLPATTPGELNYLITRTILEYLNQLPDVGYADLNDCVGAVEGAKLEFYRRVVVPYEERKITQNGDVY